MHHEIQATPAVADGIEYGFQLAVLLYVQRQDQACIQPLGQRAHKALGLVVQVSNGNLGAQLAHDFGAAVGNAVFVGYANNQAAFAGERQVGCGHCKLRFG